MRLYEKQHTDLRFPSNLDLPIIWRILEQPHPRHRHIKSQCPQQKDVLNWSFCEDKYIIRNCIHLSSYTLRVQNTNGQIKLCKLKVAIPYSVISYRTFFPPEPLHSTCPREYKWQIKLCSEVPDPQYIHHTVRNRNFLTELIYKEREQKWMSLPEVIFSTILVQGNGSFYARYASFVPFSSPAYEGVDLNSSRS